MGFVHDGGFDDPEYDIDDIAGCSDVATLMRWYEQAIAKQGDIKAQVDAALTCDTFDDDWMERVRTALAYTGMGANRLKRRLRMLGVDADFPAGEYGQMLALQAGLEQAKANTAKAKASAAFGRHLLEAMRDALPAAAVAAITAEAATRAAGPALEEAA